jgi:uncharacterized membrane protein YgdD (TMEM256/DUF423 family)
LHNYTEYCYERIFHICYFMRRLLIISGVLGFLAVAFGAFGAHSLKPVLTNLQQETFDTAIRYHFFHTIMMLASAILLGYSGKRSFLYAGYLFFAGIILFSGSLYLLSLRQVIGISSWTFLGPVTPLGGLCFLTGWIFIITGGLRGFNE